MTTVKKGPIEVSDHRVTHRYTLSQHMQERPRPGLMQSNMQTRDMAKRRLSTTQPMNIRSQNTSMSPSPNLDSTF